MKLRLADFRPPLPIERLIRDGAPAPDALPFDVVVVGAGPGGLAAALRIARAASALGEEVSVAVFEKAAEIGGHSLSGAVVNPVGFRELFPETDDENFPFRRRVEKESVHFLTERRALRLPTPPTMRNHGFYTASLAEMVRWLAARAEDCGVEVFPGFPVGRLLMDGERVLGVETVPAGLRRDGSPGPGHEPAAQVAARVVVLADGVRSPLTAAWRERCGIASRAPGAYALGVKELWRTPDPPDRVIHTLGHPLPPRAFGGSFLYPMGGDLAAIGMVTGLDAPTEALDVHAALQELKAHPFIASVLDGGECLEWGAKLIPEGGPPALPNRFSGEGAVVLGDAAGFVDVPSLKGIHHAMRSGILAADAVLNHLRAGVPLSFYDASLESSPILSDLHRTRNFRPAFSRGMVSGAAVSALATLTAGALPPGTLTLGDDAEHLRKVPDGPAPEPPPFTKLDGVFRSGNNTRDDHPPHLVLPDPVPVEAAKLWERICPAGVYEVRGDQVAVNPSNCVDCRAADVFGPRWTPREGGAGPRYRRM